MKKYEKPVAVFDKFVVLTYRRSPDFILREIADEYILVPIGGTATEFNGLASLNESGAFLWDLLEESRTWKELSEDLAVKYELTEKESRADTAEFLELAMSHGLVQQF